MDQKDSDKCLCGYNKFEVILTGKYNRFGLENYWFQIRKCKNCKLARTFPLPQGRAAYSSKYLYPNEGSVSIEKKLKERFAINRWSESILKPLLKYVDKGTLLDIGCYECKLLHHARCKGFNAKGVEIEKNAAEFGKKMGFDIFNGTLFEAKYKSDSFDAIIASHVLEHVYDLSEFIVEAYRILKKSRYLYIVAPRYEGFLVKIMRDHWAGWYINQHYWHFSKEVLETIINKGNRFELVYSAFKDSSESSSVGIKGICKEIVKRTAYFLNDGDAMRLIFKKV